MSRAQVDFDMPTGIVNLDQTIRLTSRVYPVELIEAYGVTGIVTAARLWEVPLDGYDVAGTVTEVELRPLLQTYGDGLPEGYDVAGTVTALELDTIRVGYEGDPEGYDVAGTVTALELRTLFVEYEGDPEGYDVAGTVTALELS